MYKCRGRQDAGSDQDEGIKKQCVTDYDPLTPALSRRERELTGQQWVCPLFS
jgi:hypothetical protein